MQLNEAAAFRHKREQYMHGTPLSELRTKWKPMLKDINDEQIIDTAVMHLEYASHFIEEHKIGHWQTVLMSAIAAYYIDMAKPA
jgi:hypothetical protein